MYLTQIIQQFETHEQIQNLDLNNQEHLDKLQLLSDKIYNDANLTEEIDTLETEMLKDASNYSLIAHTAVKIAKSKRILAQIEQNIHISVVIALYNEDLIKINDTKNDAFEFIFREKIKQMNDLTFDLDRVTWDMIIVDDCSSENYKKKSEQIITKHNQSGNTEYLQLKEAVKQNYEPHKNLNESESRGKGSAVKFGMWYAAQKQMKNHYIIYTDADLTIHLGQCGLLIDKIVNEGKNVAIASRREPESVIIKTGKRKIAERLFIYMWKRMLKRLNYIVDTQCGLKAFKSEIINDLISVNIEEKSAFEIELLLKADILNRNSIAKVPIAWINNSENIEPEKEFYLEMLKSTAQMYHKYLPANAVSHKFAYFIKNLNENDWNVLTEHVPEGIQIKSPIHYDIYSEITVDDFKHILESN
jgi:hypothetical protein